MMKHELKMNPFFHWDLIFLFFAAVGLILGLSLKPLAGAMEIVVPVSFCMGIVFWLFRLLHEDELIEQEIHSQLLSLSSTDESLAQAWDVMNNKAHPSWRELKNILRYHRLLAHKKNN